MPHRFSFDDRKGENQQRLAAYDRLVTSDDRAASNDARDALASDRQAFEQAYKLSESERKAQEFATKAKQAEETGAMRAEHYKNSDELKNQRLAQFEQQLAIQKAREDLSSQQAAAKNDTTLKVLEQATGFLRDARGMDPSKPQFDKQFQDLSAGYPMAFEHPSVKEWIGYHKPLREKFAASEIAAQKPATPIDPKVDTQHLSRLESLRMSPSLAKAIGDVDDKGVPKTREGQDAMDQIKYLDEQINAVRGRLSAKPASVDATLVPASPVNPAEVIDIHEDARNAIKNGAPKDAVAKRLQELGGDPSKL